MRDLRDWGLDVLTLGPLGDWGLEGAFRGLGFRGVDFKAFRGLGFRGLDFRG